MKDKFTRIIAYNLAAVLLLAIVLRLSEWEQNQWEFATVMAEAIVVLLLINLMLALSRTDDAAKRAHWLSLLLVLLIGFGACFVGMQVGA